MSQCLQELTRPGSYLLDNFQQISVIYFWENANRTSQDPLAPSDLDTSSPLRPSRDSPYLQQQFHPFNRGYRRFGNGSGDTTSQKVLKKAQGLISHDGGNPNRHPLSLNFSAAPSPGTSPPSRAPLKGQPHRARTGGTPCLLDLFIAPPVSR